MKERLINNLGLKILSVFLAFFVWLVVVNVSNPAVKRSKDIPLEILNEQVLLAANRTYDIEGGGTVKVSYKVQTRDEYKIKESDFRAYIDLADLYDVTGSVPVNVEVMNNKSLIRDVEPRQSVVRVKTEELQKKKFDLVVRQVGRPAEEYEVNGQVSHAGVEIEIAGRTEDFTGVVKPKFYDSNDNEIELGEKVVSDTPEVTYNVTINRVKKLPLDFEVSGSVAPGYQFVGVECPVTTVSVIGLRTSLASLNKLTIPASDLNLDGAMADRVITVDLKDYLPEGVKMVQTESSRIEVRLKVERLVNKTFRLTDSDIAKTGTSDIYNYRLIPSPIEVTMQGLREDLDSLTAADLAAELDLSGMEPGRHKGTLTFGANQAFKLQSYTDFEVEVTLKEPGITAESGESQSDTGSAAEASGPEERAEESKTPTSGTAENGQTTAAD